MARTTRIASLVSAAFTALVLLCTPAIGHAKTYTFGTRLDHEPSNSAPAHNCREDGSDDPTPLCTRVAIDDGDAVPGGLRAPRNGTIVKFRVRAGAPGTLSFRLAQLTNLGYDPTLDGYVGFGRSASFGLTARVEGRGFDAFDPIEEFPTRMKVHKGDYLAIDSTAASTLYCSGGGNNQLIFTPSLGDSYSVSTQTEGCDLLVQAVMKPAPRRHHRHHR
jgi:hypothetical protein